MIFLKKIINRIGLYKSYRRKIGGQTYRIPIFNKLGFANLNNAEPWMEIILTKIGSEKSHLLDVGVNVGQTLLKWKSAYPTAKYTGVEPNSNCIYYVNQLILKNKLTHVKLLPVGLSSNVAVKDLYLNSADPSDSTATTVKNFNNQVAVYVLPIVSIPFHLINTNEFDLIKIDVEGGELEVIQSVFAQPLEKKPIIICEILPVYAENRNADRLKRQQKIEVLLAEHDYLMYRIKKEPTVTLQKIDEFGIHSSLDLCDYLFIPALNAENLTRKF